MVYDIEMRCAPSTAALAYEPSGQQALSILRQRQLSARASDSPPGSAWGRDPDNPRHVLSFEEACLKWTAKAAIQQVSDASCEASAAARVMVTDGHDDHRWSLMATDALVRPIVARDLLRRRTSPARPGGSRHRRCTLSRRRRLGKRRAGASSLRARQTRWPTTRHWRCGTPITRRCRRSDPTSLRCRGKPLPLPRRRRQEASSSFTTPGIHCVPALPNSMLESMRLQDDDACGLGCVGVCGGRRYECQYRRIGDGFVGLGTPLTRQPWVRGE